MKNVWITGAALLVLGLGVVGCSNTAEGAKQDADNAGAAVDKAADRAASATEKAADKAASAVDKAADKTVDATKDAAKNTTAALEVTPKVKNAIIADSELNDTKNEINVDSADNVVHLKGHVQTNEMKKKAGDIATKTLKDMNATDTVSNELTVDKH